ncbi:MAG: ATP-binding protein, partial [Roseibium sp.]
LHLRLPDEPLNLETAPLKVEQVLVNLLRNGADSAAKAEAGEVILETGRQGESVVVSVSDNGSGVPVDLREKIFDPFFTTKLSNGGLGLGLSISDRIAEDLGGSLQVKPSASGGATFVFTLPAPEGAERDATPRAETAVLEPEVE